MLEIYNLRNSTNIIKINPHGELDFKIGDEMAIPSGIMGFSDIQVTEIRIALKKTSKTN